MFVYIQPSSVEELSYIAPYSIGKENDTRTLYMRYRSENEGGSEREKERDRETDRGNDRRERERERGNDRRG